MNNSACACGCDYSRAPKIQELSGCVVSNDRAGDGLYVMRILAPCIAESVQPGQFVHLLVPSIESHILRRPFSVYATDSNEGAIDVLYQVVGSGTKAMSGLCEHNSISVMGPIGHGWVVPENAKRVMLVGGGVGAAPLYMLCQNCLRAGIDTTVVLGAATHEKLATYSRFRELLGAEPICATDDGSFGHAGFCTEVVADELNKAKTDGKPYDWFASCGPYPVMKIVSKLAREAEIKCHVSMEEHMACGCGACLGCIVKTTNGNARACVDGPVFCSEDIIWQ